MKEVTLWLLLSVSNGWDNQGDVTQIGTFKTLDDCIAVEMQLKDDKFKRVLTKCVQGDFLIPKD